MYTLTDAKIKKLTPQAKSYGRADGRGLFMLITPSGGRHWKYKFRLDGKEHREALGAYPDIGLARARSLHAESRAWVAAGKHPLVERRRIRAEVADQAKTTFRLVVADWIAANKQWSPYYLSQVKSFLGRYVVDAAIGSIPIKEVTSKVLRDLLQSIAVRSGLGDGERKATGSIAIAVNVRTWLRGVFEYAIQHDHLNIDPTLQLAKMPELRRSPGAIKHSMSLSPSQLRDLLEKMSKFRGHRETGIAIELLMLTFVRTAELRAAKWSEFDLDGCEWRIPAARMKARKPHMVPLSRQVIALLLELRSLTGGGEYLFPNTRRGAACMCATTINRVLERMGFNGKGTIGFSAHGFRATASTILNEASMSSEAVEIQLAHTNANTIKRIYDHSKHLPARIKLMQWWADHLERLKLPPAEQSCVDALAIVG